MKPGLRISDEFSLPSDTTVTSTIVVYGAKGKGKTNFGTVLAEELYAKGLKFSALDPYGVMWGLRFGQKKSNAGIEILIIGGVHGDISVLPTSGAVVADLVSDEEISTVVDISRSASGKMWSKADKIRFVADYATRLFERQGEHQRPLMQIIDEAGRFCPQMIPHGSPELSRCVGALEELVEVGRNVGIGVTLITQRSARMAKSVSELAECKVAFCTLGPNSVEAITDWCGEHIERSRWKELVATLRTLPRGSAMVVSPGWLGLEGQTVAIRARETFDSSATPKAGQARLLPGKASIPDLAKYRDRMTAVEEAIKASDPKELRRQLAERDRQIAELVKAAKLPENNRMTPPIKVDPAFDEAGWSVARREAQACFASFVESQRESMLAMGETSCRAIGQVLDDYRRRVLIEPVSTSNPKRASNGDRVTATLPSPSRVPPANWPSLKGGMLSMLTAIAQYEDGVTGEQIMVLCGYRATSRDTYVKKLVSMGFATRSPDRRIHVTPKGMAELGPTFRPLPTGAELRSHCLATLPEGEARILTVVCDSYPDAIHKSHIREATKYAATSVDTYVKKLRNRRLVVNFNGMVAASETLFS